MKTRQEGQQLPIRKVVRGIKSPPADDLAIPPAVTEDTFGVPTELENPPTQKQILPPQQASAFHQWLVTWGR